MCKESLISVPIASVKRLPLYLNVLKSLQSNGQKTASSSAIAEMINENTSVVKKDLSQVISKEGKPKVGYDIKCLINDIESFLGYNNVKDAIIVGVGKLGSALLNYDGFKQYGFRIVAGFDSDDSKVNSDILSKKVFPVEELKHIVSRLNIKIGIITVPEKSAQSVAELLIDSGIKAIWNFTATHLVVPKGIAIKNESLATSLVVLSKQLKEILEEV